MTSITNVSDSEKVIRHLYKITNAYDKGFDSQISELLQMGLERFNLDIAILSHIKGGVYTVLHCQVPDDVELKTGSFFDFDTTYCHITCEAKSPVAIDNMGLNDEYASHPAYASFGLESYIGIPIRVDGKLFGTLNFSSAKPYPRKFKQVDIDALQLMASWIEVELVRRRQEKKLEELNELLSKMAFEDSLTSLPNRRALFDHLSKEINRIYRTQGTAALVIADIDYFKKINDIYGHLAGDTVLASIGDAFNIVKRSYDYVARFGGEEFILWLPNTSLDDARAVCLRINKEISNLSLTKEPITMSFGLTKYQNQDNGHLDITSIVNILIERADKALYLAKENGRNRVEVFENSD